VLQVRRHGAPLESCDFLLEETEVYSDKFLAANKRHVSLWIWRALRRDVRVLRFDIDFDGPISLPNRPLFSLHLTRLELEGVGTNESLLDFSGCPKLVDLQMVNCSINSVTMSSSSLQHLRMLECLFYAYPRTQMSLPNLVSLELDDVAGRAPLLESMPSLVTALVTLDYDVCDRCDKGGSGDCGDHHCEGCQDYYGSGDDRKCCVLLRSLSQATYLELSADPDMVCLQLLFFEFK
jgi:hypothetical protein